MGKSKLYRKERDVGGRGGRGKMARINCLTPLLRTRDMSG